MWKDHEQHIKDGHSSRVWKVKPKERCQKSAVPLTATRCWLQKISYWLQFKTSHTDVISLSCFFSSVVHLKIIHNDVDIRHQTPAFKMPQTNETHQCCYDHILSTVSGKNETTKCEGFKLWIFFCIQHCPSGVFLNNIRYSISLCQGQSFSFVMKESPIKKNCFAHLVQYFPVIYFRV